MFVAISHSIGEAMIQAGNSEVIIGKHYLDMKSQTEAEAFNAITPKKESMSRNPYLSPPDHFHASTPTSATHPGGATHIVSYPCPRLDATRCVYTGARVWKRNYLHRLSPPSPTSPVCAPAGFPKDEPSIRTLHEWTQLRRIPYHRVGHFVYFGPAEMALHIRPNSMCHRWLKKSAVIWRCDTRHHAPASLRRVFQASGLAASYHFEHAVPDFSAPVF